jgi:hypothetical protein
VHALLPAVPEHLRMRAAAVEPSMFFAPGPAAFFSSASALGKVAASPDATPVTKHTARARHAR